VIVVFDSSVWVSAIKHGGTPLTAILHATDRDSIVTCNELEDEVIRVVNQKLRVDASDVRDQLAYLLIKAVHVTITGSVSGVCRDPKDDFILECALSGDANLIVTGDKDLLSLGIFGTIEIVTPRQYLDRAKEPVL
jgi:putative PIN family toxin of toxin-antitoxin system